MAKRRSLPIVPPVGYLTARDRIWAAIRAAGTITYQDLSYATEATPDAIKHYVKGLTLAGYLEPAGVTRERRPRWRLIRDVGIDAPRVDAKGNLVPPTGRDRIWAAMKPLGCFDVPMLALVTGSREKEVQTYLTALERAGYVRVVRPGASHIGRAQYRMLPGRDTGPQAPAIRRDGSLYDLNLDRQVWPAPAAEEVAHG